MPRLNASPIPSNSYPRKLPKELSEEQMNRRKALSVGAAGITAGAIPIALSIPLYNWNQNLDRPLPVEIKDQRELLAQAHQAEKNQEIINSNVKERVAVAKEKLIEAKEEISQEFDAEQVKLLDTYLDSFEQRLIKEENKNELASIENLLAHYEENDQEATRLGSSILAIVCCAFGGVTSVLTAVVADRKYGIVKEVKQSQDKSRVSLFGALKAINKETSNDEMVRILKPFIRSKSRLADYSEREKDEVVSEFQRIFKASVEKGFSKRTQVLINTIGKRNLETFGLDQAFLIELVNENGKLEKPFLDNRLLKERDLLEEPDVVSIKQKRA